MNVLVTGGAGYVGSHCVRALCDAGHGVVLFDNLSTGHRRAADPRAKLMVADLSDSTTLDAAFASNSFDAVMHFAALAEVGESVREPLRYYQNNVAHTIALLEVMRRHSVRNLVFSSSCAVYGVPPKVPITEDMPKNPVNPYGRTKLAIEWALEDCARAWGLGVTALRYFNAAGASRDATIGEDHRPESHLIPRILSVALGQAERIFIFGDDYDTPDGTCVRDYVHVEDLAEAHLLALTSRRQETFRGYNVGTGIGVSVKEVLEVAREITGHAIPAMVQPRREGDPASLYADPAKIKRELNWRARLVDLRTTLASAWTWHQKHPHGFDS